MFTPSPFIHLQGGRIILSDASWFSKSYINKEEGVSAIFCVMGHQFFKLATFFLADVNITQNSQVLRYIQPCQKILATPMTAAISVSYR